MTAKLRTFALAFLVAAALPATVAWADDTGTYATRHASEPALAPGMGRIYLYREGGLMGAALQPTIMLNGESTGGRAKPGDYFYIDRPAGTYEISTTTEKKEAVPLTVEDGKSVYVKFTVSMGFFAGHVNPEVTDAAVAVPEIQDCDWHEPKPVESAPADAAKPSN